jgi:hypothetical protein
MINPITVFCKWYVNREMKKAQAKKAEIDDAQLVKAYHNLNALYDFVKFLNEKGFKNRHDRKQFWQDVMDGKPVIAGTLNRTLQAYGVKSETIKKLEEARIASLVEETKKEMTEKAK